MIPHTCPNLFTERAAELGQDLRKREFKDLSWLGLKTRSRDATLSRHKGININELYLHTKIAQTPTGNEIFQNNFFLQIFRYVKNKLNILM